MEVNNRDSGDLAATARFAMDAAWAAGRRTLAYFQAPVEVEQKEDGTPVTRADREAEAVLREAIHRRFPDDGLLGEEYGEQPGTSGRRWILDPIDGTKSFVHGVPFYAVLVALAVEDEAVLGIIHLPGLGETVAAWKGGGCHWNGREARVSRTERVGDALVVTSDFPGAEQDDGVSERGARAESLYAQARLRRTWGDAYGYAMVATGRADIMIDPIVAPWDIAAVVPIIQEAGGRFSDFAGHTRFDSGHGFATNGHLHDEVLSILS